MMADTKHIGYLDGWRGGSIFLLLVGHLGLYPLIAGRDFNPQHLGVECFFALSGRLMAEILFVRQMPIGQFYAHRVSRIFPALWLFVFCMFASTQFSPRLNVEWTGVITALTFTRNYFPSPDAMGHIWSLCVEEHAYILLSLIAILKRRFSFNVPTLLAVISIFCIVNGTVQAWILHRDVSSVYWHSDVRVASVLIPGLLYLLVRERCVHPAIPIIAIAVGFALYLIGSIPLPVKNSLGTFLIDLGVVTIASSPKQVMQLLGNRILMHLGLWSFSLYLWQQPFAHYDGYALSVLFAMLFGVSLVSFYLVERPCRRVLNDWYERYSGRTLLNLVVVFLDRIVARVRVVQRGIGGE